MVYAAILVAASVFIVLQPGKSSQFIRMAGAVGGVFFTLCLVLLLIQLVRQKVLLIINASGISSDLSSVMSIGLIAWLAVAEFGVTSIMEQWFISVDLHDVEAFLAMVPA